MGHKPENRICQNCKKDFIIEVDDFSFYEKMKVPPPTFCPECRMIRRFNFRNEGMLFRRKDAHSGQEIFSGFSPEANVLTYENSYWFGSDWDQMKTAVDYDFNVPFFKQFELLLSLSPLPARSVVNIINSDYCNEVGGLKNCYLCFNCDFVENSSYLRKIGYAKESLDSYDCTEIELSYECTLVDKSYRTFFSLDCINCIDVWFSRGLRGCTNCFGCVNLVNQSYYIFNEQYTKEEYEEKMRGFILGSYQSIVELKKKSYDYWLQFPVKYAHNLRAENSTGERIFDSKNVKDSYSVRNGENLRYCQDIQPKASNCYDYTVWGPGENIYEAITCGLGAFNIKFCFNCWEEIQDLEYCVYCIGCKNCFGCVGLSKKQYCIFNKQYTKEEYFEKREKIIKHMNEMPYIDKKERVYSYGEFFPFEISPIAYNQSSAQDFFSVSFTEAEEKGFIWRDINRRNYEITFDSKDIPDLIEEIKDEIINEIIKCEKCNKPYRITEQEFQFYRRILLPIPHSCHNCRFEERFKLVNPPRLWHRKCMNKDCINEFETSYSPDRPEIVYCENCYKKEVY